MKIDIVSLFPNFFTSPLNESLIAKAVQNKILEIDVHNLRDYSNLPHKQVDDTPYGGGAGMVLKPDVLAAAIKDLRREGSLVILTEPTGEKFTQRKAAELSKKNHLIIVCGRYEGVDQRFKDKYVDTEISIGDYVLNGGEGAAWVILETIVRLVPGVLGSEASLGEESFSVSRSWEGKEIQTLEYPQYTRPEVFEGQHVPKVLLSGNHQEISEWRKNQSLIKTKKLRGDLLTGTDQWPLSDQAKSQLDSSKLVGCAESLVALFRH